MTRSCTWVHFLWDTDERTVNRYLTRSADPPSRYRILDVVPVVGAPPVAPSGGMCGLRYETTVPPSSLAPGGPDHPRPIMHVWGVAQHLHYTDRHARVDLDTRSRHELPPSEQTIAVLIPIRKSAAWWGLSQDERQEFFLNKAGREGHIAIGSRYVEGISRRLYHRRYLDQAAPYDFLTYFEFDRLDEPRFRMLLSELRDVRNNPEWVYVEHEYEIWMTKVG